MTKHSHKIHILFFVIISVFVLFAGMNDRFKSILIEEARADDLCSKSLFQLGEIRVSIKE